MLGTGYFLKTNSQQEQPMCPSVVDAYGSSSRYHSCKQKQGLCHSFIPYSTMKSKRNRDFLESRSFSF